MGAESKVSHAIGGDARLVDLPGSKLEPRPNPERVILAAPVAEAFELHVHCEVAVASLVAQ